MKRDTKISQQYSQLIYVGGNMVKETAGREEVLLTTIIHFEHCYKIKKTSAVRSRISSKLIFASYVGYFDRAYCGFYVTSRVSVLVGGDKI